MPVEDWTLGGSRNAQLYFIPLGINCSVQKAWIKPSGRTRIAGLKGWE